MRNYRWRWQDRREMVAKNKQGPRDTDASQIPAIFTMITVYFFFGSNQCFFTYTCGVISDQFRCNFQLKSLSPVTIENCNPKKATFWGCESLKF